MYLPTQPVRGMSIAGILPGMPMMSAGFSVDEAKKDIYQIGFHVIEDPALGSAFEQMTKDEAAFDISSDTGFEFCFNEEVPKYQSDNNLLRVLGGDVKSFTGKELGYDRNNKRHPLADGGLVIWDARAAFLSLSQWSYFYVFVEEEQLKEWKKTREFWKTGLSIPASQDPDYVAQLGVYVQRDQAS
ncbi:hypothetical protein FPHYL_12542 [Fusarium phyllophilum]|uniref:Uncharacterized protein n=1 Tax=Fusarium phyllophilum TaxID=47803 RepID=A0A8H5IPG2_9HYPO|nr:hypothetical protein FPHYL_12542 [Fusarium phyllophilum]